jgi:aquaporin Z
MAKLVTECIGTFFLVLTIGLTVLDGTALAPLAIGSALMVMVYMGGHISGAHYNPAASLAILMRGKMESKELLPYWAAQIVGAILASLVVYASVGSTFAPAPASDASAMAALLLEFLFTFALCLVILNAATARATEGNSFFGLAIGFTVLAGAFAAGPVSGGAFNPAVGIGPILVDAVMGGGSLGALWLYLVGPLAGGAAAAIVFKMQNPDDA